MEAAKSTDNYINLIKIPKNGEIIEGKIIGKGRSSVFIDLGNIGTGIIYGKEFYEAKDQLKRSKVGDVIFAKIVETENEDGYTELSLSKAGKEMAWDSLKKRKDDDEILIVKILGANKGGLLAEVEGIPAFLPVSQLSSDNYPKVEGGDNLKILKALQKFVGKEMEVKIFDISSEENKLILSERAKETREIKEILKNYSIGDIVEGEITGVVDFGAFIRFSAKEKTAEGKTPELEGLIHISELDWRLIEKPSETVKVGQKVKAKIIDIQNEKISLSLKALKEDPWKDIEKEYKKDDIIKGEVTKINPFGAFIQLSPEIQGLCHISEFGTQKKMEEDLEVGKKYDFQILSIDPKEHRMSLRLK
ncbi:MAG: S1 RNA-binding domain-containing protein [Candidatus Pacebacteria bacterium]|nr:S1 RNA-binding domain-containing protein [Candidatus Paceibacterota bacterium]